MIPIRSLVAVIAAFALPAALPAVLHAQDTCPRFEVVGTGPDLVLVPGLGSSPETWELHKASLARTYRLHLVQLAGFAGRPAAGDPATLLARSEAEIIRHLDCENVKRAGYVGHSMGGFLGLMLAADHPDRISRVVVVDSLPFFPLIFDPRATVPSTARIAADTRAGLLALDRDSFAQTQRRSAAALVQDAAWQERIAGWTIASDRPTFAGAVFALMSTDIRPRLPAVKAPVRVIAAANRFAPRAMVEPLYAAAYAGLADKKLAVIENSYHFVMIDQPAAFAAALEDALGE
jgi:pimeloyl-ACP methyl ester carboxylesterase